MEATKSPYSLQYASAGNLRNKISRTTTTISRLFQGFPEPMPFLGAPSLPGLSKIRVRTTDNISFRLSFTTKPDGQHAFSVQVTKFFITITGRSDRQPNTHLSARCQTLWWGRGTVSRERVKKKRYRAWLHTDRMSLIISRPHQGVPGGRRLADS